MAKPNPKYKETKVYDVDERIMVAASTDKEGRGWYVGITSERYSHWMSPAHARKLARLLVKLSYKPKKSAK